MGLKAWHVCAAGFLIQSAGAVITLQFFEHRELTLLLINVGNTIALFAAGWLSADHVRDRREEQAARDLMANVTFNVRQPVQQDFWPDFGASRREPRFGEWPVVPGREIVIRSEDQR